MLYSIYLFPGVCSREEMTQRLNISIILKAIICKIHILSAVTVLKMKNSATQLFSFSTQNIKQCV